MHEVYTAIVTISDRVFAGESEDLSGPALIGSCKRYGWHIVKTLVINDDFELIRSTLIFLSDDTQVNLILTTGGTGLSPRDNTPEATNTILQKTIPGISEHIRRESYTMNPNSIISRGLAGIRNGKIIINLPGSPNGAAESLSFIHHVIPHSIEILSGNQSHT